jgi:hypothetical protein
MKNTYCTHLLPDLFPFASFYELGVMRQRTYSVPSSSLFETLLRSIRYMNILESEQNTMEMRLTQKYVEAQYNRRFIPPSRLEIVFKGTVREKSQN